MSRFQIIIEIKLNLKKQNRKLINIKYTFNGQMFSTNHILRICESHSKRRGTDTRTRGKYILEIRMKRIISLCKVDILVSKMHLYYWFSLIKPRVRRGYS